MKAMNTIFRRLLFSILAVGTLHGQDDPTSIQSPQLVSEKIDIQTDRELYVTGEVLWFKIVSIDKKLGHSVSHSKVAYLELIAPDGTTTTRVKTELVNGFSSGSITLPQSISSNLYTLRSYTRMMRGFDFKKFAYKQIYILNSDQSLLSENINNPESSTNSTSIASEKGELTIEIYTPSQKIEQRTLVELKIKSTTKAGVREASNISVSVSIPNENVVDNYSIKSSTPKSSLVDGNFLPESKGMELTGQVMNAFSNPVKEGIRIYLSFPGKTALVYTTFTNKQGQFNFLLPRLYGQRQVVLQLDPKFEGEYSIILDDEFHPSLPKAEKVFILPDNLIPTANRVLANTQIANSYKPFELQPLFQSNKKFAEVPFFGKADKAYKLDDYTRFPLPEFFFEVVPEVRVYGTYGNNSVGMLNNYNISQRELFPLLLVDGVPVFDQEKFLSINNKLIEYSEIVKDPYWLNTILYNGIISILSIDGDARSFSLPESALRTNFLTFLPERQFTAPDYSTEIDENLPDFRNTLFWNPSVKTDENGEATISFYTSDAIGEYEIRVEAINSAGQIGKTSKSIEVVKLIK